MSVNTTEIIFPCPFSKGYGIPARQAWLLLSVFLCYRLTLACVFIFLFYTRWGSSLISIDNSQLYDYSSYSYLIISIISAACVIWRLTGYTLQAQLLILSDILILTLLMHACGGVNSGIGTLLGVSIASGGLLIGGRCAMFFAAGPVWLYWPNRFLPTTQAVFNRPLMVMQECLGLHFSPLHCCPIFWQNVAKKPCSLPINRKTPSLNWKNSISTLFSISSQESLLPNRNQQVQMANEASLRLLNLSLLPIHLGDISEHLSRAFEAWLADPEQHLVLLQLPDQSEIHCRFMILPIIREFFMIILEDIALYNQRLQQSKLASLGRLTASIAHEIRNPLGAISHAGQLLSESSHFSIQDMRLTEIIQNNAIRVNQIIDDILQLSKRTNSKREKIYLNTWLIQYLSNFMLEQDVIAETFSLLQSDKPLCAFTDRAISSRSWITCVKMP